MDDYSGENDDEMDTKDTQFNYNYSFDFVPDWMKDAKDKQTFN